MRRSQASAFAKTGSRHLNNGAACSTLRKPLQAFIDMKYLKFLLAALIAIPVLLMSAAFIRNKAVGPAGWAEDDVNKRLRNIMKDPDSMIIRSFYIVERKKSASTTEISVCGIVDGKNSFGAYTGGQRFSSLSIHDSELKAFSTYSVEMENPEQKIASRQLGRLSPFEQVYWNQRCVDSAHPPLVAGDN